MGSGTRKNFFQRFDPRHRTDVLSKPGADFEISMCHRFGKIIHFHVWHVNGPEYSFNIDYDKYSDVLAANSWLEVMEILHG